MFEGILDPIFRPLLQLGHFWAIVILAFVLTLLITIVYKFTTDQKLMKSMKKEMKKLQKEAKAFKNNPSKAMAHQKKLMEKNMQYMKHSLKPTLYTFIPIIIIFGWLNANLAYYPITPGSEFDVSIHFKQGAFGNVSIESMPELTIISDSTQSIGDDYMAAWTLKGVEGEYLLTFKYDSREYHKDLVISSKKRYAPPTESFKDSNVESIQIDYKKVRPFGNFFGLNPGWLGAYIILSLIFSFALRKAMNIT